MASISPLASARAAAIAPPTGDMPRRGSAHGSAAAAATRTRRATRIAWLTFRVHVDAFLCAPLGYAQAVGWRLRGLKVRSRNRFAALAGRSPHAYALWIERDEQREVPAFGSEVPIRPVIDCRDGSAGLQRTLDSLGQSGAAVQPILIGGDGHDGICRVARPRDLAPLLPSGAAWLLPLCPGDELAAAWLAIYAKAAAREPQAWLIYADDDLIGADGRRAAPHFKPKWNRELVEHHDMVSGSSIVRVERGSAARLPDEQWVEALIRTACDRGGVPVHLPHVLHHRRSRPCPVIPAKPAIRSADSAPLVTAIIPTRDRHELLRTAMQGLARTAYPAIETIIVDNGSTDAETLAYLSELEQGGVKILRAPGPFNYSALNNAAVEHAQGDLLCFLNNDVEMLDSDWLALLVRHAIKPDIGAVGARLLYPDGTIQHAGVFTGIGGGAGHAHRFRRAEDRGYFDRARLPQRISAVTAACMVVSREKFVAVAGFDEVNFPVAFNDVDLCLKLNRHGCQCFYEPRATLIHHESKTRGSDRSRIKRARFEGELAALKQLWGTDTACDPYHHPNLSPFCEQFVIAL